MTDAAPHAPVGRPADSTIPSTVRTGIERLLLRHIADLGAESGWLGVVQRGRIVDWIGPLNDAGVPSSWISPLLDRIVEGRSVVMIEDLTADAVADAVLDEPVQGALLALACTDPAGAVAGVLLATSSAARRWTNVDLERSGDLAGALSSFLTLDELRAHAERRVDAERHARTLRAGMHRIAIGAASAGSLSELAATLSTEGPLALGGTWVAMAHRDGPNAAWEPSAALRAQLSALAIPEVETAADLDRLLDRIVTNRPADGAIEHADSIRAFSIEDPATDLDVVLMAAFDGPIGPLEHLAVNELVDDVAVALGRIVDARRHARTAATLQRSLLPPRIPAVDGLRIRALYDSAAEHTRVGGDWYDIVAVDDATTALVVGDVAGHDLRSAALMGQVRHVLASQIQDLRSAAAALSATDRYFHQLDESVMATAAVMLVDRSTSKVRVARAGHVPPLHIDRSGPRMIDAPAGAPLGFGYGGYRESGFVASDDDLLVAFTDGVIERREGDLRDHLDELVQAVRACPRDPDALIAVLRERAESTGLDDDAAALAVQFSSR